MLNNTFSDMEIKADELGLFLSGGMDSACLAAYMPKRSHAYTFRFNMGQFGSR